MNLRILPAILKKDVRSLPWLVSLIALLFLADPIITRMDLLPVWTWNKVPVVLCALIVLLLSVFQLDSGASLDDDWLCRPVPKRELLAAKLLLVFSVTWLPRALGTVAANLALGLPWTESFLDGLLLQDQWTLFFLPIFVFAAIITRTFVQGFGVLFAIFVVVIVLPTPFIRPPGPLSPGIMGDLLFSGMNWLATAPAHLASVILLAIGFWLVYWRRRLMSARILMAVTILATIFLLVLPMALLPWNSVFAMQSAFSTAPAADLARITLRNTHVCFPAARRIEMAADAEYSAAVHRNHLGQWDEEALADAGPDSIAFVTTVEVRGLPLEWRAEVNYVEANYSAGGAPLFSLRPARYITDSNDGASLSRAWMLPDAALSRLRGADAKLQLTYSLTLLKPREFDLPTDGMRYTMPGLGNCSARVNGAANRIDVECFTAGAHPAQISAELNGIPASRSYSRADFSPPMTQWLYGQRVSLEIDSPRLAKHGITVTAWDMGGQVQKSIELPGILGATADTCPLPEAGRERFQASNWRDAAPHEVQSIGVDDGVQLEVLDFGGQGSPIVLLPGLGATAHSFDEFAPLLARKYRVIALTRRGTGASSKPDFGFDTLRLAQDVLRVMDAMQLQKVLLVGHSIAGEELTWLGGHHANRFSGLVYLDAAYDRSWDRSRDGPHSPDVRELNSTLPPEPPVSRASFASYETLTKLLAERGHLRLPEGELIAFRHVNSPSLAGTPAIDARTQQAIAAAIEPPNYEALKIPALAIFAIDDPNKPLPPWFDPKDAKLRETLAEIDHIRREKQRRDIESFRTRVSRGEVLELANAEHYIIQSNAQDVLDAVEKFAAALAP